MMVGTDSKVEEHRTLLSSDEQEGSSQFRAESRRRPTIISILEWTALTIIIVLLLIDITIRLRAPKLECPVVLASHQSKYLKGNGTAFELESARNIISYSPRNLTGMYTYNTTTKRLTRKNNADAEYFGPPSAERDNAWKRMLLHELPVLLEQEVAEYQHIPELAYTSGNNRVHFEPEVYHVLHCLNAVRKQVNRVLYPELTKQSPEQLEHEKHDFSDFTESWQILHTEHCMDRIRQDILCHADTTPSIFHGIQGVGIFFSNPGERICRDWEPIARWTQDKFEIGQKAIAADNAKQAGQIGDVPKKATPLILGGNDHHP